MSESIAEKRVRLLEERAKREKAAEEKREAHELLVLELEDKYCRELGPRGQAWEMANEDNSCGAGPICVKLGDPTQHKAWTSKPGASPEDMFAYVKPSVVYPDATVFAQVAVERPEILVRAVAALTRLFGFSTEITRGKL